MRKAFCNLKFISFAALDVVVVLNSAFSLVWGVSTGTFA